MNELLNTAISVAPYAGGALVALTVPVVLVRKFRTPVPVTSDDLARFNSKFPLDYIARSLNDETFDPHAFLEVVRLLFVDFHHGMQTGELSPVRASLRPDLYEQRVALIKARTARKQEAVMLKFKLHGLTIRDATAIGDYSAVTVRILASSADYEIDAAGKMFGDKTVRAWEEDWMFERSTNRTTKLRQEWMLTAITPVDRNRFRPDQIRNRDSRQDSFRRGKSFNTQ